MLPSPVQVERYLTDYRATHRLFMENYRALHQLKERMESVKTHYPALYQTYMDLMRRAETEKAVLERIGLYRSRFNVFHLFDLAASLGVARWMYDTFIFSRRIAGVLNHG